VAFGVGVLAERSVAVFTVLKLFGAAYLVYLGSRSCCSGWCSPPSQSAFASH
jgi:threonine/homoserine/homoserine lactone efflux protein